MTDRIPNFCGVFVTFFFHGRPQFTAQLYQPELLLAGIGGSFGNFSKVLGFTVDILEQRQKFIFKCNVIVWTPESPLCPKLFERDPATGTETLIKFIQIFASFLLSPGGHFVGNAGGSLTEVFLRTRFAQVQSLNFTVPKFGNVQDGGFGAATALFHDDYANRFSDTGSIFTEKTEAVLTLEVSAALRSRSI